MKELDLADIFGTSVAEELEVPDKVTEQVETNNEATEAVPSKNKKSQDVPSKKNTKKTKDVSLDKKDTKAVEEAIVENDIVEVNGQKVKIHSTKFRYFRNRTTAIYEALKKIPLHKFLAYDAGVFDEERDSDQILFDFLVAVFDDEEFVKKNYNDFTAENLEEILKIFGRVNHIEEKEEAVRKNMEAQVNR